MPLRHLERHGVRERGRRRHRECRKRHRDGAVHATTLSGCHRGCRRRSSGIDEEVCFRYAHVDGWAWAARRIPKHRRLVVGVVRAPGLDRAPRSKRQRRSNGVAAACTAAAAASRAAGAAGLCAGTAQEGILTARVEASRFTRGGRLYWWRGHGAVAGREVAHTGTVIQEPVQGVA